ncbi:MAG TPA: type I methionyl aminopeptidase [Candidatus Kaiserbacteria bacterium]|nr:type I methionyl aminopeptidase [Candidatus Kaiserbacteria bacterium]
MIVHTAQQRERLIEGGKRLGIILDEIAERALPGISTAQLDEFTEARIREDGDIPSFLRYVPEGMSKPFPASICISVNDGVVHGIPNEHPRILQHGDVVSFDLGLTHEGIVVDSAFTISIGIPNKTTRALMERTASALEAGIVAAQPGARVGDISHAIESAIKGSGFSMAASILGGHGVGAHVHEEPFIANVGRAGTGELLEDGVVLALEPIVNKGKSNILLDQNEYTYHTKDGALSVHFEHTILVEEGGPLVVTRRPSERAV